MTNYEEARVKLLPNELKKLKSAAKNKTRKILRITEKNFQDEELPHEFLLTTRQKTEIRNAFANNMSKDIKLSKEQGDFLMKVTVPLAKNLQASLASMVSASAIDGAIQRNICGRGVVRAGKGITLVILNEDMDGIRRIIKNKKIKRWIPWCVVRNFRCSNVRKYVGKEQEEDIIIWII